MGVPLTVVDATGSDTVTCTESSIATHFLYFSWIVPVLFVFDATAASQVMPTDMPVPRIAEDKIAGRLAAYNPEI